MNKKSRNSFDDLLRTVTEVAKEDVAVEREALKKEGVNFEKLDSEFLAIIGDSKPAKPAWFTAAQENLVKFDKIYENSKSKLNESIKDVSKVIEAIKNGDYGQMPQQKLSAQYRNRELSSLTDKEIHDLLKDCDLLELLNKKEEPNE